MKKSKQRGHIAYNEEELLLGITMMDKLEKITRMMLYFLDHKNIKFTYILMQVDDDEFESFIRKQKRSTDILVPIDTKEKLYAIVCQETNIEGGYHFAERIIRFLEVEEGKRCLSCNVLTVSTSHLSTEQIILYLLERYVEFGKSKSVGSPLQIDFHSFA